MLLTDIVVRVAPLIIEGLREYDQLSKNSTRSAAKGLVDQVATGKVLQAATVLQAALPAIREAAGMIDDFRRPDPGDAAERARIDGLVSRAADNAQTVAIREWEPVVADARTAVRTAFPDADNAPQLTSTLADLDAQIARGKELCGVPEAGA